MMGHVNNASLSCSPDYKLQKYILFIFIFDGVRPCTQPRYNLCSVWVAPSSTSKPGHLGVMIWPVPSSQSHRRYSAMLTQEAESCAASV